MALRDRLRRLEKTMRGNLDYVELADGERYWFKPEEAWSKVFMHGGDCLRADYQSEPRPDPPEILEAVAHAKDRRATAGRLWASGPPPFMAYDLDALIERGEFVPRSFLFSHSYEESLEAFAKKNEERERHRKPRPWR